MHLQHYLNLGWSSVGIQLLLSQHPPADLHSSVQVSVSCASEATWIDGEVYDVDWAQAGEPLDGRHAVEVYHVPWSDIASMNSESAVSVPLPLSVVRQGLINGL